MLRFKLEGSNPEHGKINVKVTSAKVQEPKREVSESVINAFALSS
jgi:hypothetical protein